MGLFGKRRSRAERGAEIAAQVAEGKGFYGRMTRAFVGGEDFTALQQTLRTSAAGGQVQQLIAAGMPTTAAVVVSIADTGRLVNFDPVVDLAVQPEGAAEQVTLRTLVSKLRIPRPGDQVLLLQNPERPGDYLYAGMPS